MNENKEYSTTDIVLAASLVVHNHKMVRIDVTGSRGTFIFVGVGEDFLHDYELGQCLVNPIDFNNQIKRLTTSTRRMTQNR